MDVDGVARLLAEAIGGAADRVRNAIELYRRDPRAVLLGATSEGQVVGVVGYRMRASDVLILHIATREDCRRSGVGRTMICAVRGAATPPLRVSAETDSEAVGFYRALGFVTETLGEKYPGVQRFQVRSP